MGIGGRDAWTVERREEARVRNEKGGRDAGTVERRVGGRKGKGW